MKKQQEIDLQKNKFLLYAFLAIATTYIRSTYATQCRVSSVTSNETGGCSVGISYTVYDSSNNTIIADWTSCTECHSGKTLRQSGNVDLSKCGSFTNGAPSTTKYICGSSGGGGTSTSKCGYDEDYYCDADNKSQKCPITDDIKDWIDEEGYPISVGCCPRGVYNNDGETSIYDCRIATDMSYCDNSGCFELTDECYYSDK
ncbi:MAG: hypothetical protein NC311_09205 [Muribaculaceae bacterium]|nr:hypothetical protein [Muribaculaceae bacterium]